MEEFECFACIFGQTPSPVRVLPLIQEGEFFSLLLNILLKLLLLDKRRWIQKLVFEDGGVRMFCLCFLSNSLPHSGTPSYPRGRAFLFVIQYVSKAPPLG